MGERMRCYAVTTMSGSATAPSTSASTGAEIVKTCARGPAPTTPWSFKLLPTLEPSAEERHDLISRLPADIERERGAVA